MPRAHPPIGSCAGLRLGPGVFRMPTHREADRPRHTALDEAPLDVSPLCGELQAWRPLTVQAVSQSPLEPLWDALVRRYHYLGYQKLLGHRLKYLACLQDRPVAALAFSAPARTLRVRDQWIGWSRGQREARLNCIANNVRFLLLPWVGVPHLGSWILGALGRRIAGDWQAKYAHPVVLLETFVEQERFAGT